MNRPQSSFAFGNRSAYSRPRVRRALASLQSKAVRASLVAAIAVIASSAGMQGYVTNGHKWGVTSVPYYVNPQSAYLSQNAAVTAVQSAAAGWKDQTRANIQLVYAGTTNGSSLVLNNKNEIFFRGDSNGGNVGETYYWWDAAGKLIDADIVFYEGAFKFFYGSGCTGGVYVENVAIHELGHLLGLAHTPVAGATMEPSMPTYCDRTQLSLEPDDISGVESLYPPTGGSSPSNTAPSVTIASPANGSSYPTGSITFTGSASDAQDGNLSSRIVWSSTIDGGLGTGASVVHTLSAGTHTITARVTDNGNLAGVATSTVTIAAAALPTPTLTATGYKLRGAQAVDLQWTGLSSATVSILRNDALIASPSNSGAFTDPLNRKGAGAYSYVVCVPGSAICTNKVSVKF